MHRPTLCASVGVMSSMKMKNAPALQFPYSSKRLRRVKCLQFGIVSPDEMREMSVTQQQTITQMAHLVPASRKMIDTQQHATRQVYSHRICG